MPAINVLTARRRRRSSRFTPARAAAP